jgi:hypothetical protein
MYIPWASRLRCGRRANGPVTEKFCVTKSYRMQDLIPSKYRKRSEGAVEMLEQSSDPVSIHSQIFMTLMRSERARCVFIAVRVAS